MKDGDMTRITFLSDKNMPCAMEFALLNNEEIAELVERRLFSNNYFNYTIHSIHKSKGVITLIRDDCGHKLETTLSQIEDGLIPEECTDCRQAQKDKLLAFKDEIQDVLGVRGLIVVLFETEEKTDSLYIECTQCGTRYYLNDDFSLDDEAWEMYCKNWDCMMNALALEDHWPADDIKLNKTVSQPNGYDSGHYSFTMHYSEWVCALDEYEGSYELKCAECGAVNILPFGKWECCVCDLELDKLYPHELCTIEKWNGAADQVALVCKKCGSEYTISCEDAIDELFECFECYKRQFDEEYTCPICCEKYPPIPKYFDSCELCGFEINRKIKSQVQYTSWLRTTVQPCARVWNEIDSKYRKALNDLATSLENEKKLLIEKREVISRLARCQAKMNRLTGIIFRLNSEIKHKDAVINEMKARIDDISSILNHSLSDKPKDEVLDIPIDELDIAIRTFNVLLRAGIKTVRDLVDMKYEELKGIRNLGKGGLEDIVQTLASLGISINPYSS